LTCERASTSATLSGFTILEGRYLQACRREEEKILTIATPAASRLAFDEVVRPAAPTPLSILPPRDPFHPLESVESHRE
jgi:hypothetical protein